MTTPPTFNYLLSTPPSAWPPSITLHHYDTNPTATAITFALLTHDNTKYFLSRRFRPNGSCYFHVTPTAPA